MYLRTLQIKNFRAIKDLSIDFNDEYILFSVSKKRTFKGVKSKTQI